MSEKKVYVKPHQRQTETGQTHVRGHSRNQEVRRGVLNNQEIPEDSNTVILRKEVPQNKKGGDKNVH